MLENSLVIPRYCPVRGKEIEYDGSCSCGQDEDWEAFDEDFT